MTDRKALMATCLGFFSEIKRLGVNYHGAECTASSLEGLKNATSKSQVFTTGYPNNICTSDKLSKYRCSTDPGIDCSGFVSWIAYATFPGQFPRKASTSTMVSSYVGSKLIPVSQGGLLPGDIALKKRSCTYVYREWTVGGSSRSCRGCPLWIYSQH